MEGHKVCQQCPRAVCMLRTRWPTQKRLHVLFLFLISCMCVCVFILFCVCVCMCSRGTKNVKENKINQQSMADFGRSSYSSMA